MECIVVALDQYLFRQMAGMVERSSCLSNDHKINEFVEIFSVVVVVFRHNCARRCDRSFLGPSC